METKKKNRVVSVRKLPVDHAMRVIDVKRIPVLAITTPPHGIPLEGWQHTLCHDIMRFWESNGYVQIIKREFVVETALEAYSRVTAKGINKDIDGLIAAGIFREDDGWLVPLEPVLSRTADHEVEREFPWCIVKSNYGIDIKLKPALEKKTGGK